MIVVFRFKDRTRIGDNSEFKNSDSERSGEPRSAFRIVGKKTERRKQASNLYVQCLWRERAILRRLAAV